MVHEIPVSFFNKWKTPKDINFQNVSDFFKFKTCFMYGILFIFISDDDRCRKKVNIGFVLDSSKSMSTRDYEKQKQFVKSLAATFSLSPQTSRAGAIVYSDDAVITARFGQYSYIDEFKRAVDQFYYMGKRTRIDKALKLASETFFTEQAGARSENENIMVILTGMLKKNTRFVNF